MKHLISLVVIVSIVLFSCGGKKTSDEQVKKTKIEAEEAFEELEREKYKE